MAEKYPQGSLINMLKRRNKDLNMIFMSLTEGERGYTSMEEYLANKERAIF